jgi:hypothetical protein
MARDFICSCFVKLGHAILIIYPEHTSSIKYIKHVTFFFVNFLFCLEGNDKEMERTKLQNG